MLIVLPAQPWWVPLALLWAHHKHLLSIQGLQASCRHNRLPPTLCRLDRQCYFDKNISITATPIGNFAFSSTGPVVVSGSASLPVSNNQTIVPKLDVYSSNTKNWDKYDFKLGTECQRCRRRLCQQRLDNQRIRATGGNCRTANCNQSCSR